MHYMCVWFFLGDNEFTNIQDLGYLKEKSSPVLKIKVKVKESAFQDEFVMYREVNRFITGMHNAIDKNNVPVNGSAREMLLLTANQNDENLTSCSEAIQDPQIR